MERPATLRQPVLEVFWGRLNQHPTAPRGLALGLDFDTHLAGGAGNDAVGGGLVAGVEVLHLDLHDVLDLLLAQLADFLLVRLLGTDAMLAAFLIRIEAGGLLVMKVKLLSL